MATTNVKPGQKIVIAGGGPAGSSVAIRLARSGFDVSLIERERFPRQKLCGEFISPECLSYFDDLGVLDDIAGAGGEPVSETRYFGLGGKSVAVPTEWFAAGEALSLSRAEMDLRLLRHAEATGVRVVQGAMVAGLIFGGRGIKAVKLRGAPADEMTGDIFIDATGRAKVLCKLFVRQFGSAEQPDKRKQRFVGFNAHLRGARPERNTCEIYSFRGGYGGLSRIEGGGSNLCFLVRADVVKRFDGDPERLMRELVMSNRRAAESLAGAVLNREWLSVSVESFGTADPAPAQNLFAIGDAAAFIDPFTGSGMLMALESAGLLADCIGQDPSQPAVIGEMYRQKYREHFGRRLRICRYLRRAAYSPVLANAVISMLRISENVRQAIARRTRPRAAAGKPGS